MIPRRLLTARFSNISTVHHVRKFYKEVKVVPFDDGSETSFTVKLDDRTMKTADGHKYFVPSETLAHIVAMEFYSQKDYIISSSMPLVSYFDLVRDHQIGSRCRPQRPATTKFNLQTL